MYLLVGALHYSFDSGVKIYYYGFTIFTERCKLYYFFHHVATVVHFKSLWMVDHYTWFMAFCPAYHCALVVYPALWINNYVYGFALVCYVFHQLYIKELRDTKLHRSILLKCPLLIIPIIFMATADCNAQWSINDMKDAWNAPRIVANATTLIGAVNGN